MYIMLAYVDSVVEADGLVMPLMHVCPKVKPTVPFTQLEVKHDSITLINELGAGCFGKVYKGMDMYHFCLGTFWSVILRNTNDSIQYLNISFRVPVKHVRKFYE